MKVFLCGQTGNINRGCEAIIRSSIKVLNRPTGEIYLASFSPESDLIMAREEGINLIPYANYPTKYHRTFYAGLRKVFKKSLAGISILQKPLFDKLDSDSISLNIGGDTYCYRRPIMSLALNKYTKKRGIKNILWCCSIEKDKINKEIFKDLNRYSLIFAREQITYNNLIEKGIDKEKIVKVCDPAFFLDKSEVPLPDNFIPGNTIGINLSEMVVLGDERVYHACKSLIKDIIEQTDMNICLVPHVYSIKENRNDYPILKRLYDEINSDRICIIDKEYNCMQLKYLISNCRFFIGARTHSTIAAYSSEIPTLVIGYSVKSKGIAQDLFGSYKNYVLPYEEVKSDQDLKEAFNFIVKNELAIKDTLKQILPYYKKQLIDAVEKHITRTKQKDVSSLPRDLCSGCSACMMVCPKKCISMQADNEGFLRPIVEYTKCIQCGKCREICPTLNKPIDNRKEPKVYAVNNLNQEERLDSSSGGIFSLLAKKVIDEGGVVFGVALNEENRAIHIAVENEKDLSCLRGSKYVQSDVGNIYEQVKNNLTLGRKVLFSGTPCQIGGLKAYLEKDYNNLLCVDICCHGVPSPKAWKEYLKLQEKKQGAKVKEINFRDKSNGWLNFSIRLGYDNNTININKASNDVFMKAFLGHLSLRLSCHNCSFKQIHRQSDVTLADYWGVNKQLPEMFDDKGTSLVFVHSQIGKEYIDLIKEQTCIKQVTSFSEAIKENKTYIKSSNASPFREEYFKKLGDKPFDKLVYGFMGNGVTAKIRRAYKKFIK